MSSKKPCINNPAFSYTGNEQSPLHFGLTAEGYPINAVMEGYDKKLWAVEIKNNKKVWIRKDDNFRVTHEEPIIKSEIEPQLIENESIPINSSAPIQSSIITPVSEKKTTDYNLYLSWRLKQLKEETVNTSTSHECQENKKNFTRVLEEWKIIKNKPDELKKILEEARAHMSQNIIKNTAPKKKTIPKLPSIEEENTATKKTNKKNKK